jgi:2-(1,2-epoxy-1,2-dihydrophenyl)acetyl-CoA isomerase
MSTILVERAARFATVTLNRPEKLNAFGGTMREELLAALESLSSDRAIRSVIITGAGRGFCSGGDVAYMAELQQGDDRDGFRALLDAGAKVVTRIRSMPQIAIAAVNGVAAGAGCNLALACDYRIAADSASFSQAFVKIGLHPDWGGTWSLPRLVGPTRAMEILVTGRRIDATEALALGMVDRVVPTARVMDEARGLAEAIGSGPGDAIADIKRSVWTAMSAGLEEQLERETAGQLRAFSSRDGREGVASFLERRKPDFE